jgi:hypothetical protein
LSEAAESVPFRRSDFEFFHQDFTSKSLLRLTTATSLTIYCGAGVTIDRTGYGWGALIASVFSPDATAHASYPTPAEIELLQAKEDPLRLASILTRFALDSHSTEKELKGYITPLLQNRLYRTKGWQAGRLTRNVCNMAIAAATLGIEVNIVTTNYDTYIEDTFMVGLDRIARSDVGEKIDSEMPGLSVFVYRGKSAEGEEVIDARQNPDSKNFIRLHYVHGRVPKSGVSDGHLVISELDYASSRHRTEDVLSQHISSERPLLIVGASLTDPPLINALADSVPNGEVENFNRFAVMPRTSFAYQGQVTSTNSRLVSHMSKRAELLGVRLLVPDFRFQVAQFCQELSSCIESDDAATFLSDMNGTRYGLRLMDWWDRWSISDLAQVPVKMFMRLEDRMTQIRKLINDSSAPMYGASLSDEVFRLELWVRERPRTRNLTLWGSTAGPMMDTGARRNAPLELNSSTASVRAFAEGRPQHIDGEELGASRERSRWKSYLCVPYYYKSKVGRLPVGVITLASSAAVENSALPLANISHMEALRDHLMGCGQELLEEFDQQQPGV